MERIILDKISLSYQRNDVLTDVSLTINQGDYIGIKGDNGSGKTTLLNIMLKLLKPTKGKVENTFKKKAFVSQLNLNQNYIFPCTIREIVSLGLKNKPFSFASKKDYQLVDEYLEKFNLLKYKNQFINELSGGEQQKVRILKALISDPSLLILDEPTSGVDEASKEEINKILLDIHLEKNMTLVIVSHLKEDFKNADKIYTLKEGKLYE